MIVLQGSGTTLVVGVASDVKDQTERGIPKFKKRIAKKTWRSSSDLAVVFSSEKLEKIKFFNTFIGR